MELLMEDTQYFNPLKKERVVLVPLKTATLLPSELNGMIKRSQMNQSLLKEIYEALLASSQMTSLMSPASFFRHRVCCNVISYEPHDKHCKLLLTLNKVEKELKEC